MTLATLNEIAEWPVDRAAAAVCTSDGVIGRFGETASEFALASVTKPLFAYAMLIAHEEGTIDLDETVDGRTVAQRLAHVDKDRRRYRNANYDELGQLLEQRSGFGAHEYFAEAVAEPLGLARTRIDGSVAAAGIGTADDLAVVGGEWLRPTLIHPQTWSRATTPCDPELAGILPGFGYQSPNPWGLGPEIRGHKEPHWLGVSFGPEVFGHFGQAGTFVWVDPVLGAAAVVLTDRDFGPWAIERWAPFNDRLRAEIMAPRNPTP